MWVFNLLEILFPCEPIGVVKYTNNPDHVTSVNMEPAWDMSDEDEE